MMLPIKEANTSIIDHHELNNFSLPVLYDLKLLMLHWRSFCNGYIYNMQSFDLA